MTYYFLNTLHCFTGTLKIIMYLFLHVGFFIVLVCITPIITIRNVESMDLEKIPDETGELLLKRFKG